MPQPLLQPGPAAPKPPTHRCCLPNSCCRLSAATGEGGGGPTQAGSMLPGGPARGGPLGPHCCPMSCTSCWVASAGNELLQASAATMWRLRWPSAGGLWPPAPKCVVQPAATERHRKTASWCASAPNVPRASAQQTCHACAECVKLSCPPRPTHITPCMPGSRAAAPPTHSRPPTFPIARAAPRALWLPGLQRLHPSELGSTPHGRLRFGWQH